MHILPGASQGSWKPSLNVRTMLTSIQLLMTEPNPDDPLMVDIVRSARGWRAPLLHILELVRTSRAFGSRYMHGLQRSQQTRQQAVAAFAFSKRLELLG